MDSEYHYERGESTPEVLEEVRQTMEPFEVVGSPGDCIFQHHRLLHSAGLNRSPDPRIAVLCDYQRGDRPMETEPSRTACSLRQLRERGWDAGGGVFWMMHNREFKESWPPRADMWEDWQI